MRFVWISGEKMRVLAYTILTKTGHVRITWYWGVFTQQFLPSKRIKYYICKRACVRVRMSACSLAYRACNAYAPYCNVICGPSGSIFFPYYLTNCTIFGGGGGRELLNRKCVFWFYLQLLFETFLIQRRIQRDIVINVKTSSRKVPVILVGF
jgi:hypothetical protein